MLGRTRYLAVALVLAACGTGARPSLGAASTTTEPGAIAVPASAPDAYVIGDSLTVGVQPYLKRAFAARGVRLAGVDGRVFRTTAEGLRVLRAKASRLPDTVVLALGTNDLTVTQEQFVAWLRQARSIVGPDTRLIWINIYVDLTRQPKLKRYRAIDDALELAAPRYGIEVADWAAWVEHHDVPQQRDGVHYTEKGYRIRAAFYARAVTSANGQPREAGEEGEGSR